MRDVLVLILLEDADGISSISWRVMTVPDVAAVVSMSGVSAVTSTCVLVAPISSCVSNCF
jgi:hypothetical protein